MNMPGFRTVLLVMTSLVLVVPTVAGAREHNPRVTGSLHNSTCPAICIGHNGLADDIHGSNVWCAWSGNHVRVHVALLNTSGHDLELKIQPTYYVRDHGRHGSSSSSRRSVKVRAHAQRQWFGDAGEPEGVVSGTPISSCEPALKDVFRS
jgi:hypothetical protein